MKKWIALLTCLLLPLSFALAEGEEPAVHGAGAASVNASVVAPDLQAVTAPFSGTLLPFTLTQGDRVFAGDALFEIDTVKVYAPQTGTLSALFAKPGDDAGGLMNRYGALAVIEPEHPLYVAASTSTAYDESKNKYLHTGETLYLKCGSDKGTGRVTSVEGGSYTVEILTGDFDLNDTVKCYRESGYASDSVTGSGKAHRYPDVSVSASGRVLRVHAKEGDAVRAGDLLFEMVDQASAPATDSCIIPASAEGAVQALYVASGAQVYKGQLLCEIANLSRLELSCEVDEIYLSSIQVGSVLTFELDAYPSEGLSGTVTEIRPLGESRQNAAYFDVRVTLPEGRSLLPGMNATVYIE